MKKEREPMEPISKSGTHIFRGNVRPDSKPLGTISIEPDAVWFTPTAGMSFTHQDLYEISEFLKLTVNANDVQMNIKAD